MKNFLLFLATVFLTVRFILTLVACGNEPKAFKFDTNNELEQLDDGGEHTETDANALSELNKIGVGCAR
jgi:hypothetical protein